MKDKIEEKTSCFACCPITKAASQFTMSGVKYKNNAVVPLPKRLHQAENRVRIHRNNEKNKPKNKLNWVPLSG